MLHFSPHAKEYISSQRLHNNWQIRVRSVIALSAVHQGFAVYCTMYIPKSSSSASGFARIYPNTTSEQTPLSLPRLLENFDPAAAAARSSSNSSLHEGCSSSSSRKITLSNESLCHGSWQQQQQEEGKAAFHSAKCMHILAEEEMLVSKILNRC